MANAYTGEIRMIATNVVPPGWAPCDGRPLSIDDYTELYTLIGGYFGGSGQNFFLPDLRGRTPINMGTGNGLSERDLGNMTGTETVSLTQSQMPSHYHKVVASAVAGTSADPTGSAWAAASTGEMQYSNAPSNVSMSPACTDNQGNGQPHNNLMPYQVVSFIICLNGTFPSNNSEVRDV